MSRQRPSERWNREHGGTGRQRRHGYLGKVVHRWWLGAWWHAWQLNHRPWAERWGLERPYQCRWGRDYRDGETARPHYHVGRGR